MLLFCLESKAVCKPLTLAIATESSGMLTVPVADKFVAFTFGADISPVNACPVTFALLLNVLANEVPFSVIAGVVNVPPVLRHIYSVFIP